MQREYEGAVREKGREIGGQSERGGHRERGWQGEREREGGA